MNSSLSNINAPIRAELVAAKVAAIKNFEYPELSEAVLEQPRYYELLWFIQWASMQPGGLKKFCSDFLAANECRIKTATMAKAQTDERGSYAAEVILSIWREIPERKRPSSDVNWLVDSFIPSVTQPRPKRHDLTSTEREQIESNLTHKLLADAIAKAAAEDLPSYLLSLCVDSHQGFNGRWYFVGLMDGLLSAMDKQSVEARRNLASTVVAEKVFDALDYAIAERGLVTIQGESRFGKTEAVRTWCLLRPGKARLLQVPCSNSEGDLLRAIAAALGIEHSYKTAPRALKELVEFVLLHSKMFLVCDEAQFLLPSQFSKNSSPARLNWVRTEIVDKGLPLALVATPQSYAHSLKKFVNATGYNFAQIIGRTLLNVVLPRELDRQDVLAVARIHFPDVDEDCLMYIGATAMQSESYLQTMEAIANALGTLRDATAARL